MKKFGFLIPIILFLLFSFVSTRMFAAGTFNPTMLVGIMLLFFVIMLLARPKKSAPKPVGEIEKKVRGEFGKDAFAGNAQLNAKFQSALKDYSGNMPKSAMSKLEKLAPLCETDADKYAVAMASGMCCITNQKFSQAIREYNKAIVLCPSAGLALEIGSCQQRLGDLDKAMDSYEFALDLDPKNVDARCRLATACVADHDFEAALDHAQLALDIEETNASALATSAICYGLLNDPVMTKFYTEKAVSNGYSQKKIEDTISALKKRT